MVSFTIKTLFASILVSISLLNSSCSTKSGDETKGRIAPLLEGMGDLRHPITTKSETAQRFFNQGLTLSYAFNHK